jgi:hypothetical protein
MLRIREVDGLAVRYEAALDVAQDGMHFRFGFSPDGDALWWINGRGERWIVAESAGRWRSRRLGDDEALPEEPDRTAVVRDGLLVVGDLAIPIDDTHAVVSTDGRYFASYSSHYALEDGSLRS